MICSALTTASRDAAAQGEHRWGGLLFDVFAREASGGGVEAWTVEDGGRIRYLDPATGEWDFQDVPDEVQDTLHRVFFLPGSSTGWAVGKGGWVLKTANGGSTWAAVGDRIAAQVSGDDPYEELFDVHFVSSTEGYLVGLHSFWFSDDGGDEWTAFADPYNEVTEEFLDLSLSNVELYSIDIQERSDGSRLGLITAQPGIVIRCESTPSSPELTSWSIPWDISSLCDASPCGGSTSDLLPCACDICPGGPEHVGPWFEAWGVSIGTDEQDPLALFVGGVGGQCGMVFASTDDGVTWSPEPHECTCNGTGCQDCTNLSAYNDDPQNPFDLNRLQFFRTLYDVGEIRTDNSAHAVGYNGQIAVRDPATGVWQDRSIYAGGVPTVPGSVIFPLIGAGTAALSTGDVLLVSGEGGHLLSSTDDGDTWDAEAIGEPHRIEDVFFKDVDNGWHVGQFFRIAKTQDGGVVWDEQFPLSAPGSGSFQSVVFASTTDMPGVAVGDPVSGGSSTTVPKTRRTDAFQQSEETQWLEDISFQGSGTTFVDSWLDRKSLQRATWVGGDEFWAVGEDGLILKSTNAGQLWRIVLPESASTLYDFQMEGVAFVPSSTTGLIVGRRPVSGTVQGVAYQYKDVNGNVTWTSLAMPSGLTVTGLWDVAISGTTAWFCGEQTVNGEIEGVVLSSTLSSGNFGSLSDATPSQGIPLCVTGDDRFGIPVLMEIEVAPNTGAVWTGGVCGRLWARSSGGTWSQVKSATDAHILGLSFVADGSGARGFVGGFRATQTQQCITSVH